MKFIWSLTLSMALVIIMTSAITATGSDFEYWVNKGNIAYDQDNHSDAIGYYQHALELQPENTNVLTDIATSYRSTGQINRAILSLEKVLWVYPGHETAMYNLGFIYYYDLHDTEKASEVWGQLVRLTKNDEVIKQIKGLLGDASQQQKASRKTDTGSKAAKRVAPQNIPAKDLTLANMRQAAGKGSSSLPQFLKAGLNPLEEVPRDQREKDDRSFRSALELAAANGQLESIKQMLSYVDLAKSENLHKAMLAASLNGRIDIVKLFVAKKSVLANVGVESAVSGGHLDVVKYLVPLATNHDIKSLFKIAIGSCDNSLVFDYLVSKMDGFNHAQYSAEHLMHKAGTATAAKYLIQNKFDVNAVDDKGFTPLHRAAAKLNAEVADVLLKNGADIHAKSKDNLTPLMYVASGIFQSYVDSQPIIDLLLRYGADVNETDKGGQTLLFYTSRSLNLGGVKSLIKHGADVNHQSNSGETALMQTVRIPKMYLKNWKNLEKVVQVLLEAGARTDTLSKNGRSVIEMNRSGIKYRDGDYAKWLNKSLPLLTDRSPSYQLFTAVQSNDRNGVHQYLQQGGDPNYETSDKIPLLSVAMGTADIGIIEALINAGASVRTSDSSGQSPLHYAANFGHSQAISLLVSRGADFRARDREGFTPLHSLANSLSKGTAPKQRLLDAARLLVNKGADINARNTAGETPLMITAKSCDMSLKSSGASTSSRDTLGLTAGDWMNACGSLEKVHFLSLNNTRSYDVDLILHYQKFGGEWVTLDTVHLKSGEKKRVLATLADRVYLAENEKNSQYSTVRSETKSIRVGSKTYNMGFLEVNKSDDVWKLTKDGFARPGLSDEYSFDGQW